MSSVLSLASLKRAVLYFEGPDLKKFLQGLLSNDVKKASLSEIFPAFYLSAKGKWLSAFYFLFLNEQAALVICSDAEKENFLNSAQNLLLFSQTKVEDRSDAYQCYFLNYHSSMDGLKNLPENSFVYQINSTLQIIAIPQVSAQKWMEDLKNNLNSKITILTDAEFENLRIELEIPRFGLEITADDFPQVSGLNHFISYDKGCYVGQETIARIKNYGRLKESLAFFSLEGDFSKLTFPCEIICEGKNVGKIHSCSQSEIGKGLAIGRIRLDSLESQQKLEVNHFASISCQFLKILSPPCSL